MTAPALSVVPAARDATCARCGQAIGDGPWRLFERRVRPVRMHESCWREADADRMRRQEEARIASARKAATRRIDAPIATLPPWDLRPSSPEFVRRVRAPELRRWAETWSPIDGSAALSAASGAGKTSAVVAALRRHHDAALAAIAASTDTVRRHHGGDEAWTSYDEDVTPLPDNLRWLEKLVWTTGHAIANARRGHPLGQGEPPLLDQCIAASLLVVDELGFEGREPSPDLFGVLDARYCAGRSTIITTGLTPADFQGRYGAAFLRRLCEEGRGALVQVKG